MFCGRNFTLLKDMSRNKSFELLTKLSSNFSDMLVIVLFCRTNLDMCFRVLWLVASTPRKEILFPDKSSQSKSSGKDEGILVRPEFEQSATNALSC